MKKIIIRNINWLSIAFIALTAFLLGCQKQEVHSIDDILLSETAPSGAIVSTNVTRSNSKSEFDDFSISKDLAILYAESFDSARKIVSVEPYVLNGVECIYIVNFEKGWMAIPSDMRVQSVLGDNEEGCLYPKELDNPGVRVWLESTAEYIYIIKTEGIPDYDENKVQMWRELKRCSEQGSLRSIDPEEATWVKVPFVRTTNTTNANVDRLLSTHWGQKSPWNCTLPIIPSDNTKRFVTGCVPTAISQVMYYFNNYSGIPNDFFQSITSYISGSTSDGGFKLSLSGTGYSTNSTRWSNMPLTQSGSGSFANVSDLMALVGVRVNATYYPTEKTSATQSSYTLSLCNITSQQGNYNYNTVKSNLLNNKPVLIDAINIQDGEGHAWIIDGCYDNTLTSDIYSIYYIYQPGVLYPTGAQFLSDSDVYGMYPNAYDGMSILESSNSYQTQYLIMNWGWADYADNGYYSILEVSTDWEEGLNYCKWICYNLTPGQLGSN